MNNEQPPAQMAQEPDFVEPQHYVYSNAYRIYGSGVDVTIEFGRTKPMRAGQNPTIHGEVGVIMNLSAAQQLLAQLAETIERQKKIIPPLSTFDSRPSEDDPSSAN